MTVRFEPLVVFANLDPNQESIYEKLQDEVKKLRSHIASIGQENSLDVNSILVSLVISAGDDNTIMAMELILNELRDTDPRDAVALLNERPARINLAGNLFE